MANPIVQETYGSSADLSPGEIARGAISPLVKVGKTQVGGSGRKPRPGDVVVYDATNDAFAAPSATSLRDAFGVVQHLGNKVASGDPPVVEYEDGDTINVVYRGVVGVRVAVASGGTAETIHVGDALTYAVPSAIGDVSDWAPVASTARAAAPSAWGTAPAAVPATVTLTTARTSLEDLRSHLEEVRTALAAISPVLNQLQSLSAISLADASVAVGAEVVIPALITYSR